MKKLTVILLALAMSACHQAKEDKSTENQATANPEHVQVHQNFSASCVKSAVGNDTQNESKRAYAAQICECVYQEGITQYGGEQNWVKELKDLEKNTPVSEKLNKFSDEAIHRCVSKNPPSNTATATASQPK